MSAPTPGRRLTRAEEARGAELFAAGASERDVAKALGSSPSTAHRLRMRLGALRATVAAPAPERRSSSVDASRLHRSAEGVGRVRHCPRCGADYEPHLLGRAFRANSSRGVRRVSTICAACEQTARDQRKAADRWPEKAGDTIRRHAERLKISKRDLIAQYGWEPKRLAHDAEFQYGNGCNYCGEQYKTMGHGTADITLDIVDRAKPPYYRTNTKWCCQTCNRKKGSLTPEDFELDRQVYEVWSAARKRTADQRGMLF